MANGNSNNSSVREVPANRVIGLMVLGALGLLVAIRAGLKVPTP